jgi:hypothetical protein
LSFPAEQRRQPFEGKGIQASTLGWFEYLGSLPSRYALAGNDKVGKTKQAAR